MGTLGILFATLAAVVSTRRIRDEYKCYAKDENQYLYFGTKTSYAVMFQDSTPPFQSDECSPPLMLWEMVRHGTRYPMFEEHRPLRQLVVLRNRIMRNHKIFNNVELCAEDLDNLGNWTFDIPITENNRLSLQGKLDMESLARHHQNRYPILFHKYQPDQFLFQITESDRTNQSAQHFLKALFPDADIPQPEPNNPLLRSYMNCSTWMLDYASSRTIKQHRDQFHNSLLMSELVDRVSRRLGFFFDIRPSQVDAMYKMCAYDKAYKPHELSAWCAAFTEQELRILEYREDLLYYYKHGPGMGINLKIACPLLRDMFVRLNESISNDNETTPVPVVMYFTHNGMFERFLARLGVLNSSTPLTEQYDFNDTRSWRLAKYIPFAANLAVTLHSCSNGYKVALYLNERPLELENCTGGVCDWDMLYDKFQTIINSSTCNLQDCYVGSASRLQSLSLTHWAILLLGFLTSQRILTHCVFGYSCSNGYKVALYLNERPLELENCTGGVCDWDMLYDKFQTIINSSTCNLQDCYVGSASRLPSLSLTHWAILLLGFLTSQRILTHCVFGYSCTNGYKVALYLNERPLELENCTGGVCDWDMLYDKFQTIINSSTCNLQDCYVGSASRLPSLSLTHWAILLLGFLTSQRILT